MGTTQKGSKGEDYRDRSCVDLNCRVHNSDNLYLGGCNVIPSGMACNPTLTAIAFAIRGATHLYENIKGNLDDSAS